MKQNNWEWRTITFQTLSGKKGLLFWNSSSKLIMEINLTQSQFYKEKHIHASFAYGVCIILHVK